MDGDKSGPTEQDLLSWANDVLSLLDPVTDGEFFRTHELRALASALRQSKTLGSLAADASDDAIWWLAKGIGIARLLRSQWVERQAQETIGGIRAWHLLRALDNATGGETFQRLTTFFQMHPRDYLRSVLALHTLAAFSERRKGWIEVPTEITDDKLVKTLNLDPSALELVANRLSQDWEAFSAWDAAARALPAPYQKFHPLPFVAAPLIRPGHYYETPHRRQYVCPSPGHLMWHLHTACRDALAVVSPEGVDFVAKMGTHVEDYLHRLLVSTSGGEKNVIRVPRSPTTQRADFIVRLSDRTALIVECKSSLGSAVGTSVAQPRDAVEILERLYKSYSQCAALLKEGLTNFGTGMERVRSVVSIVCFDEVVVFEGGILNRFLRQTGGFAALGLDKVEALSLHDLEHALLTSGPHKIFRAVEEKWKNARSDDMLFDYLNTRTKCFKSRPARPLLAAAEEDLFPGFTPRATGRPRS